MHMRSLARSHLNEHASRNIHRLQTPEVDREKEYRAGEPETLAKVVEQLGRSHLITSRTLGNRLLSSFSNAFLTVGNSHCFRWFVIVQIFYVARVVP
jgi:hypothetical protein